jgi:hypothetical protein
MAVETARTPTPIPAPPHAPVERRSDVLDLAAFVGTAVASFVLQWDLAQFVWGLWLSSLVVGYALIVYGILAAAYRTTAPAPLNSIGLALRALGGVGALFMLGFFTVHFGGFHYVHGIFLGVFFPLAPGTSGFDAVIPNALLALRTSWPLVLGSAIAMRGAFTRAAVEFKPETPYKSVIRMHFLIFVFAGAKITNVDSRWLYIVVLFFYYFPLSALRSLFKQWRPTT